VESIENMFRYTRAFFLSLCSSVKCGVYLHASHQVLGFVKSSGAARQREAWPAQAQLIPMFLLISQVSVGNGTAL